MYIVTNMVGRETNLVGHSSVAEVFATPTLAALLAQLTLEPERTFYQRELVNRTGGSLYLVQRELKRLERVGLVVREQRGRQVEYRYNSSHPAAAGLRDAMLRSVALADRLRAAFAGADAVELAFVFGSVARGEEQPDSDLDLFVVGDLGLREVAESVMPLVRELGREPNIVVMKRTELGERAAAGDHFVGTVLSEPKIWLVGDDAALEQALG